MIANRYAKEIVRTRASRNARRANARGAARLIRPVFGAGALGAATVPLAADMTIGAVVVVEEYLLERGLAAGQCLD